jgi:hypothetical protein
LLIERRAARASLCQSRIWLAGVEKVREADPNKINNLRALFFLQRCRHGSRGFGAPQHGFCAQVKAGTGEIPCKAS